jgi:ParB family chromosome partitioning protein
MIRLLDLPPEVQDLVRGGALSMSHARAILGLSDEIDRIRLAERVIREELSVRAVGRLIRDGATAPKRRVAPRKPPQVMALESELRGILGTKVRIEDRRGKGRILIDYYSPEEFERIVDALRGERGFSRPEL